MRPIILFIPLLFLSSNVNATPPTELAASYNIETMILAIEARHPTNDVTEHFIRKVSITINDQRPVTKFLTKQQKADRFYYSLNIELKPKDHIFIEIFCNEGGNQTFSLDI